MASKVLATSALLLTLNLLFFTMVSSAYAPYPPSSKTPSKSPSSSSSSSASCPMDALKLGVCANLLNLVNATVGSPPTLPCCSLINGLLDLEVAACLCTAIKANVLGINLNIPVSLSVILNNCGKNNAGFQCA